MMSAHDRRDGVGEFWVAEYLAELNVVHLVLHYTPDPGCGVVVCLVHWRAPGLIDSEFRSKNRPIKSRASERLRLARNGSAAHMLIALSRGSRSKLLSGDAARNSLSVVMR